MQPHIASLSENAPGSPSREHAELPAVLLVDDEPAVLGALRRQLRGEAFRVLTAADGASALRALQAEEVGVVVSDYRMPGMNGAELLDRVRREHPETLRILLTGQADMHAVADAINRGAVYKFLVKPWEREGLVGALREALALRRLAADNRRLSEELRAANAELKTLNAHLEQRVEQKARELLQVVHHDALTGLPNRSLMSDRLAQAVLQARRAGHLVAVLLLGVDRFKLVNETFGQAGGDELLRGLAERLSAGVRACDTLARTSGDEFGLVVGDIGSVEQAKAVVARLFEQLDTPFSLRERELYVTASVGISLYPSDGDNAQDLLRAAGSAMHHAKENGGARYSFYAEELNRWAQRRLSLEAELRRAVEERQLALHYQPRVCGASGRVLGAEALLRWRHAERGWVSPSEFVPLLEETGLIEPVGDWILLEASRAVHRWNVRGRRPVRVSVNLSPRQLRQADFRSVVERALAECGAGRTHSRLELEITENLLLEDGPGTLRALEDIHGMGVEIAIDDFGTGYSSLSYLTRFPIDWLKIDRTFISKVGRDRDSEAVVEAIISMAHKLRIKVVAEGVETRAQWDFLRRHDCNELQGYLFSRALPEDQLVALLRSPDPLIARGGDSS